MVKLTVTKSELARLAGTLDFLKGVVERDRKAHDIHSYDRISQTTEDAILECRDIADRLLTFGLKEED